MRFVSYYSRAISDDSGVTAALWAWAAALSDAGQEVVVVHAGGPRRSPAPGLGREAIEEVVVPHRGRTRRTYWPVGLDRILRPDDVLILHEGWVVSNLVAARDARRVGCRYVVVPHGVYEPGILATLKAPRRLRTRFERGMLEPATGVHVFYESEGPLVRAVAPRARIIVAPTGFDIPDDRWTGGGGYIAWLGRYDPLHKGIDMLIAAVASLAPEERPRLELRGPDYGDGYAATQRQIDALGLGDHVRALGPVSGAEKLRFLVEAEAYVHPSRWESHSIALLENLSLGVPSLVSSSIHAAAGLERADAAIIADPTVTGLADGLRRLRAADPEMGGRARAYVASTFAWPVVIPSFIEGVSIARR